MLFTHNHNSTHNQTSIILTSGQRRHFSPQFLYYSCISTHCFHSLCQFLPRYFWCISKPKIQNLSLAALGVHRVIHLNFLQSGWSDSQLYPKWEPVCSRDFSQLILNLPQCKACRGNWWEIDSCTTQRGWIKGSAWVYLQGVLTSTN